MSVKYCGLFTNNEKFECLGECEDIKFKKSILKYSNEIVKEPLTRKIELSLGLYITFIKFQENKVILCVVANCKYSEIKNFIEKATEELNKAIQAEREKKANKENEKIKDKSSDIKTRFQIFSEIIDKEIFEFSNKKRSSINYTGLEDINFSSSKLTKSDDLVNEKLEYLESKGKLTQYKVLVSEAVVENAHKNNEDLKKNNKYLGIIEESNLKDNIKSCNDADSDKEKEDYIPVRSKSKAIYKHRETKVDNVASLNNQDKNISSNHGSFNNNSNNLKDDLKTNKISNMFNLKPLPSSQNTEKIIEIINNDIKDIKSITKENLFKVIHQQDDLNELLIRSKDINTTAFEYKENANELKKITCCQSLFWTFILIISVIVVIWGIISLSICGNIINPFCRL